ncbi:hypothetical protein M1307_03620, partial [Patescibacteria group bacterium]|nr:hypothetical protein [Patescibacteria group bacterium]
MVATTELLRPVELLRMPELRYEAFLGAIGMPHIKNKLTPETPWAYASIEASGFGLTPGGGLGILTGDRTAEANYLGIPFTLFTPFYPQKWTQKIDGFYQTEEEVSCVSPEEAGFKKIGEIFIKANSHNKIP